MRGLWLEDGRALLRDDLPEPRPAPGECRVRVRVAGVCATDLALRRGYMGFRGVPGHEFVGEALDGPLAGQRVVGEINAGCGSCSHCAAGDPRHCPGRSVLGILHRPGAFAEELSLPVRNLAVVPDELTDDEAAFTEPVAAACAILEQVTPAPGERVVVVGDGRLGLCCAQVLAAAGASVEIHGRHPERSARLAQPLAWIPEPERHSCDLVVEATGDPRVLQAALGWVRPRGRLILKTTAEQPAELDLSGLVVDEIALLGSRCGRFSDGLEALRSGQVQVASLVDERFPLARAPEALERAGRKGTLKVLIDVAGS